MEEKYCYDEWSIRPATLIDLGEIIEIWKEGLSSQHFEGHIDDTELIQTFSSQIQQQTKDFKFWICLSTNNKIVGWQAILPFHASPNPAVHNSFAQASTYVAKAFQRKSIGKILLNHALNYCREKSNIKYIFGLVLKDNAISLHMCEELGFHNLGTLPKTKTHNFSEWDILVHEI